MADVQLGPVTHLSPADVQALWVNNGGDPAKALTAAAIVFSSENPAGNAGLVNDNPDTGDYSIGLWQINYIGSLMATRSAQFGAPDVFAASPDAQARAAIAMSGNGTNWQAWGPDFGYPGYGHRVTDPTPDSRVGQWLAANGASAGPSWLLPVVATGIVAVSGAVAAWIWAGGGMPPLPRLPRFAFARDNPLRGGTRGDFLSRPRVSERDPDPMLVQSLLFPLDRYNVPTAKRWAKSHGYRSSQVDVTDRYIHLVQFDPSDYRVSVIRTIEFGRGIKAHVARERAA